jgi:hypothetical protein
MALPVSITTRQHGDHCWQHPWYRHAERDSRAYRKWQLTQTIAARVLPIAFPSRSVTVITGPTNAPPHSSPCVDLGIRIGGLDAAIARIVVAIAIAQGITLCRILECLRHLVVLQHFAPTGHAAI